MADNNGERLTPVDQFALRWQLLLERYKPGCDCVTCQAVRILSG